MAAPKPKQIPERPSDPDDFWALPPDGSANVMDEKRRERLLQMPGVVVHRRDPNTSLPPPTPILTVGHISIEELRRLLGREPYEDEDDAWFQGEDDESADSPTGAS